jgi:hypothetical protein
MGASVALQIAAVAYRHYLQNPEYKNNLEVTGCEFDVHRYFQCYKINCIREMRYKVRLFTLSHMQTTEHRCRIDGCIKNVPGVSFGPDTRYTDMSFLSPFTKLLEWYEG